MEDKMKRIAAICFGLLVAGCATTNQLNETNAKLAESEAKIKELETRLAKYEGMFGEDFAFDKNGELILNDTRRENTVIMTNIRTDGLNTFTRRNNKECTIPCVVALPYRGINSWLEPTAPEGGEG